MRLRGLELDQFRKFDHPVRVTGIADGLNLLAGPNEMGKSTLLAALCAALFEKHRSGAQSVKSLQPAGHEGTAPWVALDFERDGAPYRIEKRFLRRPLARLTLADGRRIEGDRAEEQLHRLLSAAPGGKRIGGATPDIWSLLWVGQGGSFALPELADGARATLQGCLDAEVGEIMGGAHGPAIRKAIEAARLELVDRRGNPRARYREVLSELADLDRELTGLERRRADLEQDLSQREDAERRLVELRDDPAAAHQEAELTRALAERDDLMRRAAERARIEADLERARHALALAESARDRRRALCDALIEAEAAVGTAETALAEAKRAEIDLGRQRSESEAGIARLRNQQAAAVERREALQRLCQALRQRDNARAGLDAAATEVSLELEDGAEGRVRLNDAPVEERAQTVKVLDRLVLEIAGIGLITVRPVIRERARLGRELAAAERQIAKELRQLDLGRPPEPVRQLDLGLDGAGPVVQVSRRRGAVEPDRWPEAREVDAALERARAAVDALAEPVRRALAESERLQPLYHRQHAELEQAELRVANARRRVQDLQAQLDAARKELADPDLAAMVVARAEAMRAKETALERLGADLASEGLPALEERIAELRTAVETRKRMLDELKIRIEGLRARVQVQAGEALDERLELGARRRQELDQERAKYTRDARALELLLEVLDEAERAAKERYLEPVVARIRPYLEALFPGAGLAIDEAFRITAVRRGPGRSEPFERLSDGTREQIAILARLAFAELLTDQGLPAVVILDDALVFSDDRRIVQMFEILERAAHKLQIIVLTCREQLFEGLAATRLRLDPAPDAAASA